MFDNDFVQDGYLDSYRNRRFHRKDASPVACTNCHRLASAFELPRKCRDCRKEMQWRINTRWTKPENWPILLVERRAVLERRLKESTHPRDIRRFKELLAHPTLGNHMPKQET